ncbi:hypothetical protein [Brevundimonas sp.]|uniref:hypothetical protein n=1 Tax=Brevundimonas sp. TaxID=1871086 RepID=UPI0025EFCE34|nr:hypothetical protein [Brevundimonas sp.]
MRNEDLQLEGLTAAARSILEDLARHGPSPDDIARAVRKACAQAPDLPSALVAALVRELEGAARPVMVAACGSGSETLARGRFGSASKIYTVEDSRQALASCRSGGRAVISMDRDPWWARLLAEPKLSVIDDFLGRDALKPVALAVAPVWSEPSGADRTWWATDATETTEDIQTILGKLGLSGREAFRAGGMRLFALDGYVQPHDDRLAQAPGRLSGVIGAVPLIET